MFVVIDSIESKHFLGMSGHCPFIQRETHTNNPWVKDPNEKVDPYQRRKSLAMFEDEICHCEFCK